MKRCAFGLAMLLILLLAGCFVTWAMARCNSPVSDQLSQAAEAAGAGDWNLASSLSETARNQWEKNWHFCACFADHGPMEEIDALFAQMEVYRRQGDTLSFSAACAQLSRQIEAMGDAHSITWWNFV